MSAENPNLTVLRKLYEGWHETKGGNVEDVIALMDEEVQLSSLANGAQGAEFTQQCSCLADVRKYFEGLLNNWTMLHYHVVEFIADGDRVVVVCHTAWNNNDTGKSCETPKVDIWRFENGRATSLSEYYDTAALFAAATP